LGQSKLREKERLNGEGGSGNLLNKINLSRKAQPIEARKMKTRKENLGKVPNKNQRRVQEKCMQIFSFG